MTLSDRILRAVRAGPLCSGQIARRLGATRNGVLRAARRLVGDGRLADTTVTGCACPRRCKAFVRPVRDSNEGQ